MCPRPPRLLAALALLPAAQLSVAAPVQFGSPLAPGPVLSFGCEAEPTIVDTSGNYGLVATTKGPDCTWRQAGVWGSESDPRVSSVPGDGRITGRSPLRPEPRAGADLGPAPARHRRLRRAVLLLRQRDAGGPARPQRDHHDPARHPG